MQLERDRTRLASLGLILPLRPWLRAPALRWQLRPIPLAQEIGAPSALAYPLALGRTERLAALVSQRAAGAAPAVVAAAVLDDAALDRPEEEEQLVEPLA